MAKQINFDSIKKPAKRKDLLEKELTNGHKIKTSKKATSAKKKKVGRPKKAKEDLLSEKITMYVTKNEAKRLEELSKKDFYDAPLGKVLLLGKDLGIFR